MFIIPSGVADSEYDFTSRRGAPVAESKSLKSLIFQFHTSVQQHLIIKFALISAEG